ncbi:L-allo-threonine aldolase-like isoform X2 [Lasioglossum baleicum]|uniref:L-allo-threonine aldolase-like isoform X2 n=1 Tax=Lasioglossum baleicum TaxID=434251 RepID=UPI003FCC6CD4
MSSVDSNSTNNTPPSVKKKVYKKNFCEHWLNEPIFASWLEKYNGNVYNARCKACNTNFKGGKSELLRHVKTTVHAIQMQRLRTSSEAGTKSSKDYERTSCANRTAICKIEKVIDLRSDTLTKPTKKMREAMANAEVGDDVFSEDPTVQMLEEKAANILEMESALFVSSGTMGNLIAIMNHCNVRGSEAYCGSDAHCILYEQCGAAQLAGVNLRPLQNNPDGTFNIQELQSNLRKDRDHEPISKLVIVENTINGKIVPQNWITELIDFCKDYNLKLHMDGARLWNASVGSEKSAAEIVAGFDSVTFCLSKGLGAPVGSVLCGSKEFIEKARRVRKVLGGGMRQVGVIAAAGIVALDDMIPILKEDHRKASEFAKSIKDTGLGIIFQGKPVFLVDLDTVQTNMVFVKVDTSVTTAMKFANRLGEICSDYKDDMVVVKCLALNDSTVRFVFYHEITDKQLSLAIKKVKHVMVTLCADS